MTLALQEQYNYYVAHENDLLQQYSGKHLIISDTLQVFSFNNPKEAYRYGVEHFGAGHFLLHQCLPGSLDVVHTVK